ncbi:hypothetical protein HN371_09265 [Candidatus Poribacteria bacterium]|nr:hypothetical protein [Candidatus Poribacteria bacterium]MBT7804760.1 hypothetical protein [Candidatus Poribacteria bacterium]
MTPEQRCLRVNETLPADLYTGEQRDTHPDSRVPWRISPEPYWITPEEHAQFEALGHHILSFYEACNLLYSQSVRGVQPDWVAEYLDIGKDDTVRMYSRMNRFKRQLPLVIRPDVIPTDDGMVISELDSVPGGVGFTANLSRAYSEFGDCIVGGAEGMVHGFAEMVRAVGGHTHPRTAITVSDEAGDYRPEMEWLAEALRDICVPAAAVHPRDLRYDDETGVMMQLADEWVRVDVLYRFFELFDLRNVPKSDLFLYAARKNDVAMTPPPKPYLEEKMLFSFLHHPALQAFWKQWLPAEAREALGAAFPRTWVMDPTDLPPHAYIHGLTHHGGPVQDFRALKDATQRERELVIKPSGYSEMAWGSRGVVIGHDIPADEWADSIDNALEAYSTTPHILQEFHKGKRARVRYYDFDKKETVAMNGRARLTPYYFVVDGKAKLCGIQATVCPADKKVLHGMVDAVVAPCAVSCGS